MKTTLLNIRLQRESKKHLEKLARQWGRTPDEAGSQLLEEELRRQAFSKLEFRSTPTGRHAYLAGTRLALWQIAGLLQQLGGLEKTARHLHCPVEDVRIAQLYARAYPEEIETLIAENKAVTFESLSQLLPGLEKASV